MPAPDATALTPTATQPVLSAMQRLRIVAADIKLAHSIFALPFAMLAAAMALPKPPAWGLAAAQFGLVVLCMITARTWAMLVNRLADRRLDAANPRTSRRAFASGQLSLRDVLIGLVVSALGFAGACAGFGLLNSNWWPLIGALPILLWVGLYSYTKRFTPLCHIFLGGALAAAPLAAAVAVGGLAALSTDPTGPALWSLAAMIVFWVAGFDVIYALQDMEHDRAAGLNSIPAALGWAGAVWVSRALHTAAFALLLLAWRANDSLGWLFGCAVAATGILLVCEHVILAIRQQRGIGPAFFLANGLISLALGVVGSIDILA